MLDLRVGFFTSSIGGQPSTRDTIWGLVPRFFLAFGHVVASCHICGVLALITSHHCCPPPIDILQMSFETTTDFMAKAAVAHSSDRLKSPSARIVMGRVGDFGTGMFDLRQPVEFGGIHGTRGISVGGSGGEA